MWQESISWRAIKPTECLSIFKNQIITHTLFYHNFYFYDLHFNLTKNIKFVRIKQKNYKYDNNWQSYLEKFHIAYVQNDFSKQYAWFIQLSKKECICLYKTFITYMLKGYIKNNAFFPMSKIDYLSYIRSDNKENKILNFLLANLDATNLLSIL